MLKTDLTGNNKPYTRVYKKQIIEGFSIPAIIHNSSYFFTNLDVYEDGRVECWKFEDFEHFKNDVERGWVKTGVPDNKDISISDLGSWTIEKGEWRFTKGTFIAYVQDVIKVLNPKWKNIHTYYERKINGVVYGEKGSGTIYKAHKKPIDYIFSAKIEGTSVDLFYKLNGAFYLVQVNVFADDSLEIARLENPIDLNIQEVEQLISAGTLLTDIPIGSIVYIYGLGNFSIQKKLYCSSIQDKLLEIRDIQKRLKGEPTAIEHCRQAYQDYMADPTTNKQENLKRTYEDVPNHIKKFVGDQDTKDIVVRMIIYGDQEIEKWSHYQLAKQRNEPLPTITFPKPKDI
jgi:hypothetical protein